jgi:cation transport ATPase
MKKIILLAAITFILGGIVNAQTSENVVKGIHGGVVFGSEDLKFEYVEKGSDVLVYPVAADGKIIYSSDLGINESIITGESMVAMKDAAHPDPYIYQGTHITNGMAVV